MATQDNLFKSYRDTKGPEATNKWVEEQRALGNPKILDKRAWYEKNKRWYGLHPSVLSIERVEILDTNSRYIMIPKLSDSHRILRADTDNTEDSNVLK